METFEVQQNQNAQGVWQRRPALSALIRFAVVATPVIISVGVALTIEAIVTEPSTTSARIAWWLGIIGIASLVMFVVEKLARRALPLAALLTMGMLFPGTAPKRLAVAKRAASTRGLERCLVEARSNGLNAEPVMAAERIVALAASLSAHDRKTRGHTERVRALTDMVADELRLPESDRDKLRWAALLHDVGKLTVHPDVLNKEGQLSQEEWDAIREHPLEGAVLTAPLADWLGQWSSTIAEHHERYDGTGYPFGLSGDSISLGGRIVAVADAYDVMTSVRSYKPAMSPEAARIELARCAGTQFDPEIVRAFLAVPIRRLRGLLPLSWLGSVPFADTSAGLAYMGQALTGLVAVGSILALTSLLPLNSSKTGSPGAQAAATAAGDNSSTIDSMGTIGSTLARMAGGHPGGSAGEQPNGNYGGGSAGDNSGVSGSSPAGGPQGGEGSNSTSTSDGSNGTGGTGFGSIPGTTFGIPATTIPGTSSTLPPGSTTTTSGGGGGGGTTTTTTGHGGTTTTTTRPPTTTTTEPGPPTNLSAKAECEALVLLPEIGLTWTASSSNSVSGYEILRSSSENGSYTEVTTVSGRTTTSYTDTSVGYHTTYWYIVADMINSSVGPGSGAADATTAAACL